MSLAQCMGGWCAERENCAHYVSIGAPGRNPSERLCADLDVPILWKAQQERAERLRLRATQMLADARLDPISRPFAQHWASLPEKATA